MAIGVRPATAADLEALRASQFRPDLGLVDQHFEAQQRGTLILAVAFDGEEPVGTAVLDLAADSMTPELRNMYVYPHARRGGP